MKGKYEILILQSNAIVPNITVAIGTARELAPLEILYADSTEYLLGGSAIVSYVGNT